MATKNSKSVKTRTASEVLTTLADKTGLTRKQVSAVVTALTDMMKLDLAKKGAFSLSRVFKAVVIHKAARKARKGINPFTKEEVMFKAKPARKVVRIRPAKALKDSV